jgi:leucyl/phenylalanyl-tRNA--protein transferase
VRGEACEEKGGGSSREGSEVGEPHHVMMIPWLEPDDEFPPVDAALIEPNGLLAAGAELTRQRLLAGYRRGIFPWFNDGDPVLWWSPDPRMVLFLDELHVSKSLRKVLRAGTFEVTFDSAFAAVMNGCAAPRGGEPGTWITDDMTTAYADLHANGYGHSVEVWQGGVLAGGLYGVAVGRMFFGESMFSRQSNASKVALAYTVRLLSQLHFGLIDCQMPTSHLASLGAREIPRHEFVSRVATLVDAPAGPDSWSGIILDPF